MEIGEGEKGGELLKRFGSAPDADLLELGEQFPEAWNLMEGLGGEEEGGQ